MLGVGMSLRDWDRESSHKLVLDLCPVNRLTYSNGSINGILHMHLGTCHLNEPCWGPFCKGGEAPIPYHGE